MNNKLISIVVPVYNVEKYLFKCIDSIIKQTYNNLQIIIVDDGSTDSSSLIADRLGSVDNRIEVIHKSNGGLSSARNEGLKYAKGDYVMFIDSDDYISLYMCETLLNVALSTNSDLVECGLVRVSKNHEVKESPTKQLEVMSGRNAVKAYLTREKNIQSAVWVTLYKMDVLFGLSFEVGRLHEDGWFKYKALYTAKQVALISDNLYYYIQGREGSIMTVELREKNVRDVLDAFVERYRCFENVGDVELAELAKVVYFNNLLSYHYSISALMHDRNSADKLLKEIRCELTANKNYILNSTLMRNNRIKFILYYYFPIFSTFISNFRFK